MQPIVTTTAALTELAARLDGATAIGLDTEFLRERTYRAELCLVQVATADYAACIDPLALPDLGALAPSLIADHAVKVMHASRQDVEVLFPVTGLVRPIFDTQIAAALTGLPAQIGYGELVRRALGTELAKSHTRTDWSRRPLSPEQVDYALDDVRYLLPLKNHLEEQLDRLGRLGWLAEELASLADSESFMVKPEGAWQRLKGLRGLDAGRMRLARELAAWRERRAIERNRPRGWILEDAVLREIVMRVPRTIEQLQAIPEMAPGLVKHCGEEILAMVNAAEIPDPPPPVAVRPRPSPEHTALIKKLGALNQSIARTLGLSPEVLATRRDIEQLAEGGRDVAILQGWRREIVGEPMLAAL
ncbi:MAG TPA: ribonuclease D [Steroidobacteraceae bacterium]|nr:ribonuclease D [Steroidobacteraceae bacterium]